MKYYKTLLLVFVLFISGTCQSTESSKVLIEGNKLYLIGTFHEGTFETVIEYLDQNSNITMIVFTANGGSVHDSSTLALGREIRRRGLHTHLIDDGVVASGGLSLFLSGHKRSMDSRALVGVHSWQRCWSNGNLPEQCKDGKEHARDDPNHELHSRYIEEMLGGSDFYWFSIEAAPSASIYWMSATEIIEYKLTNSTVEPLDIKHPFGSGFARERIDVCGKCEHPD